VLAEAYVRWGDYEFIRDTFRAGSSGNGPDDIERYVDAFAMPGAARSGLNYYRALGRWLIREAPDPRRIEAPVLVIWGDQDPYLGAEWAEPRRQWVPDLRIERLRDAGHWPHIDQPERVNSMLLEFMQQRAIAGSEAVSSAVQALSS
jgi:pimeloyl-ACP methyl ester carboxylesterase